MNYDELLAPAAKFMRPSGIRKFFDLAAEMPHCISLGVGEPDFKTPWTIRDAGIRSLEQGRTRYTANAGIKELRAEICRYLARRMELNYQPSEVLVTVGGSEAIDLTIRALVKPGDEVIIPEPCFVCYEPITSLTGGVPVHIATKVEDDFRLRADQLRAAITPRTKLLILPYPNNPTGGVMDAALRSAYFLVTGKNPDPDAFTAVRGMDGWKEATFNIPGAGDVRVAVVSSLGKARKLIEAVKRGDAAYDFVEVMACPGGCAGGGGQPIHDGVELAEDRGSVLWQLDQNELLRFSHENPDVKALYKDYLGAPLGEKSHHLLHTDHFAWEMPQKMV